MTADFTFLHAADVHLDGGFSGVAFADDAARELVANAARRAFTALCDAAIARNAALLVISGDLYDGAAPDVSAAVHVRRELRRLAEAGVEVAMVRGNHDCEAEATAALERLDPPPNLHVFSADRAETLRLDAIGAAVHGRSFPARSVPEDLSRGYPDPVPGLFNIGALHTSLDGREGHADYAPCSVAALREKGYGYWALGHVHAFELAADDPPVVFPGCLQGRHARETGPKGAVVVAVRDGRATPEFLPLDVVRWLTARADVSGAEDLAAARAAMRDALAGALAAAGDRPAVARLRLDGATPLDSALRARGPAALAEDARAMAADLSDALIVEAVRLDTRPPGREDPVSLAPLAGDLAEAAGDPDLRAQIEALRAQMADAGAPGGLEALPDVATLIGEARRLILARDAAAGAEEER